VSTAMVRAPDSGGDGLDGLPLPFTCLTRVSVPSRAVRAEGQARARIVPRRIGPCPIAGVAITFICLISVTAIILLPQTENSTPSLVSMARPEGPSHGSSLAGAGDFGFGASISTSSDLSSRLS